MGPKAIKTNKDNKIMKMNKKMNVDKKNNKSVCLSDMDQPIVTAPSIDKMSVVIDIPDPALLGHMNHEFIERTKTDYLCYRQIKASNKYTVGVQILCPDENGEFHSDGPSVLYQATKKDHPNPQIRLSLNPMKVFGPMNYSSPKIPGDPVKDYLDLEFQSACGSSFFEMLAHARVTNIEIYRNILFRSPDDYLFRVKSVQTCQSICGKNGKLQTLYFGKRAGNQTSVYNKSVQLHGKDAKNDCIRVEVRLKPKKMKIHELWSMANPLDRVSIYSLKNDKPPFGEAHWIGFQDSCRLRGITKAIATQPKECRYKLGKAVAENPVNWWAIDADMWDELWTEVLDAAWLTHVPKAALPLSMEFASGNDGEHMSAPVVSTHSVANGNFPVV